MFCDCPAEPSEEAGGDENSRWQKTNHTSLYRPAGHGVKKNTKHKAWLRILRNYGEIVKVVATVCLFLCKHYAPLHQVCYSLKEN